MSGGRLIPPPFHQVPWRVSMPFELGLWPLVTSVNRAAMPTESGGSYAMRFTSWKREDEESRERNATDEGYEVGRRAHRRGGFVARLDPLAERAVGAGVGPCCPAARRPHCLVPHTYEMKGGGDLLEKKVVASV